MAHNIHIEEYDLTGTSIEVLYFKPEWKESKHFNIVRSEFEYWLDFMDKLECEDKDGNAYKMPLVYYWDNTAQVKRDLADYIAPRLNDANPLQGIFNTMMEVANQYSKTA